MLKAASFFFFQKRASYSGIRIFNNLPQSITSLSNEKPKFKGALKNFYMHTPFKLWMNLLHVQANWIGHILRRNCLLQQVIEGTIKGQIDVKRRREEGVRSYWMTLRTEEDTVN